MRIRKTRILGIGLVCLLSIFVISSITMASKVPSPEQVPIPSSITPLVLLQGSDYEIGYQYGYQAAKHMSWFRDKVWAEMMGEAPSGEPYEAGEFTQEDIQKELKGFQYYIEKYAPEYIDIFKGMADGSTAAGYPLTYTGALLMNAEWDMWDTPTSSEAHYPPSVKSLPPRSCSSFAAWEEEVTKDYSLVAIHSNDDTPCHAAVKVVFPNKGNNVIAGGGETGTWAYTYLQNNKGLFVGLTACPAERPVDNQYGLPVDLALFHIARFADNAEEAKDMLMNFQLTNGYSYLFADPSGTAYAIETTGAHKAVRRPGDFGEKDFLVITNHYLTEEMQVSQEKVDPKSSTARRYEKLFNALKKHEGHVNFEFAKLMLRTPPVANAWNRNQFVGVIKPDAPPETYVCTGSSNHVGEMGTRAIPIRPTYSFYQLVLEESPLEVVNAARDTASDYIAEARTELNKLSYSDVEYSPLSELMAKAVRDYWRGEALRDDGILARTEGYGAKIENERLNKYHKALVAFTRAQAIAKQVQNVLVPFPTSPSDLGLKEK